MNQGKYVFAQLTDFLPQRVFDSLVYEYNGNQYISTFPVGISFSVWYLVNLPAETA
jgi:hypothetical protein